MLKRIFSYMKQYKKYACLALSCIAVEAVLELICKNCSTRIICPVLLIGSHSVIPSTIPRMTAIKTSNILTSFYPLSGFNTNFSMAAATPSSSLDNVI